MGRQGVGVGCGVRVSPGPAHKVVQGHPCTCVPAVGVGVPGVARLCHRLSSVDPVHHSWGVGELWVEVGKVEVIVMVQRCRGCGWWRGEA